jgi:hypothetical protein
MSVASSAASERSVAFQGEEMSAEQMLDTIIREVQGALNGLQVSLRNLCALDDQQVDEDTDFKEAVALEDATVDLSDTIKLILTDLVPVVGELRGKPPTKESKAWWAAHKKSRKEELAREKAARKAEVAAAAKACRPDMTEDSKLPGPSSA